MTQPTKSQIEHADRSRLRTIYAVATAVVLWLAANLPTLIPRLHPLLPPWAQSWLTKLALLVGIIAPFFAKDSGPSNIPSPKGDKTP